jgi:hypothetical protein
VITGKNALWWGFCGSLPKLPKRLLLNLDAITDHVMLARAKTSLVDAGHGMTTMMPSQARMPSWAEHGYSQMPQLSHRVSGAGTLSAAA